MKVLTTLVVAVLSISWSGGVMADSQPMGLHEALPPATEWEVRLSGVLRSHGIDFTREGVIQGLKHEEPMARVACLSALSQLAGIKDVPAISELLDDPVRFVRSATVRTLDSVVSRETLRHAERLRKESEGASDRLKVAVLLCDLGDPGHYEEVLTALQDPQNSLFTPAVRSVSQFAKYQIVGRDREPIDWVQVLTDLLKREDLEASKAVEIARALERIGTARAIDGIREALERQTDPAAKMRIRYLLPKE